RRLRRDRVRALPPVHGSTRQLAAAAPLRQADDGRAPALPAPTRGRARRDVSGGPLCLLGAGRRRPLLARARRPHGRRGARPVAARTAPEAGRGTRIPRPGKRDLRRAVPGAVRCRPRGPRQDSKQKPGRRSTVDVNKEEELRKLFEIGGFVAAAVLIAFGIAAIVMGFNGRNTVSSSLKQEYIR